MAGQGGVGAGAELQRLHIGGVAAGVTEEALAGRLAPFGTVLSVSAMRSPAGEWRGFAYADVVMSAAQLTRCQNTYNSSRWRGMALKIGKARDSYMTRLQREWQAQQDQADALEQDAKDGAAATSATAPPTVGNILAPWAKGPAPTRPRGRRERVPRVRPLEFVEVPQGEPVPVLRIRHPVSRKVLLLCDKQLRRRVKTFREREWTIAETAASFKRMCSEADARHGVERRREASPAQAPGATAPPTSGRVETDEEEPEQEQDTPAPGLEIAPDSPAHQPQPQAVGAGASTALFDASDSEPDTDDGDDERAAAAFQIRPEYEGESGERLFRQQLGFKGDARFKLTTSFLDDDGMAGGDARGEGGDEGGDSGAGDDATDRAALEEEKKRQLRLLSTMGLGYAAARPSNKPSTVLVSRFDPTAAPVADTEVPDEPRVETNLPRPSSREDDVEMAPEPEDDGWVDDEASGGSSSDDTDMDDGSAVSSDKALLEESDGNDDDGDDDNDEQANSADGGGSPGGGLGPGTAATEAEAHSMYKGTAALSGEFFSTMKTAGERHAQTSVVQTPHAAITSFSFFGGPSPAPQPSAEGHGGRAVADTLLNDGEKEEEAAADDDLRKPREPFFTRARTSSAPGFFRQQSMEAVRREWVAARANLTRDFRRKFKDARRNKRKQTKTKW